VSDFSVKTFQGILIYCLTELWVIFAGLDLNFSAIIKLDNFSEGHHESKLNISAIAFSGQYGSLQG
jgi:hypothetical protein